MRPIILRRDRLVVGIGRVAWTAVKVCGLLFLAGGVYTLGERHGIEVGRAVQADRDAAWRAALQRLPTPGDWGRIEAATRDFREHQDARVVTALLERAQQVDLGWRAALRTLPTPGS